MKYCQYCGAEVHDDAVICIHCGRSLQQPKSETKGSSSNSLVTIAKVFMIIGCVLLPSIGLLYGLIMLIPAIATATAELVIVSAVILICFCMPLAWRLPMTIAVYNKTKRNEPIGVALKVCTLLFVSVIAGIMLLCANDEE